MPNNIYHKRNANSGVAPTAAQLVVGEIALNTADGKAYTRKADGTVVELTEASVADGGEQFTPLDISNLALWLDASDTGSLYTTNAGPVTAVSAPTDITGCIGWWDANDVSSITQSAGLVSQWDDKSGNNRHASTAGSTRPAYTATGIGGKPSIVFDGNTTQLVITGGFLQIPNVTIFAVINQTGSVDSAGTYGGIISSCDFSNDASPRLVFHNGFWRMWGYTNFSNAAPQQNTPAILCGTATAGATDIRRDGYLTDSDPVTGALTTGSALTAIGTYRTNASQSFSGQIAEIIVYPTALSLDNRARVEAYLAAKWGISGVHAQATAASDPVGYWADKSGNNRHATRSIANRRPTISATAQNGKQTIAFAGASLLQGMTAPGGQALVGGATFCGAYFSGAVNFSMLLMAGDNAAGKRWDIGSNFARVNLGWYLGGLNLQANIQNTTLILTGIFDPVTNTATLRMNGAEIASATASPALAAFASNLIGVGMSAFDNEQHLAGRVFELTAYNRTLPAAQARSLETYLATKWGITLAPPVVSNADAQDWVKRVYANGGAVTSSTAAAVNTFCNAIDAAGLRDRFYRLNLFCGTGLSACLTPLYRGPSLSGAQFGNATDTNVNFLAADYAERGAVGGLKGNGSSKYLETGVAMTFLGTNQLHMYVSFNPEVSEIKALLAARANLAGSLALENNYSGTTSNRPRHAHFGVGVQPTDHCAPITGRTQYLVNFDGTQPLLMLGRNVNLNNSNNAGAYSATNNEAFLVFAGNQTGTGISAHSAQRMDAYSFGAAFTSTAQRNDFHTAMSDFRTTLSRT